MPSKYSFERRRTRCWLLLLVKGKPCPCVGHGGHETGTPTWCESLQQVGIEGCGGESRRRHALRLAAATCSASCVDIMAILTGVGMVDTGDVLCEAMALAGGGGEVSAAAAAAPEEGVGS